MFMNFNVLPLNNTALGDVDVSMFSLLNFPDMFIFPMSSLKHFSTLSQGIQVSSVSSGGHTGLIPCSNLLRPIAHEPMAREVY
jgi:hypothetical protein